MYLPGPIVYLDVAGGQILREAGMPVSTGHQVKTVDTELVLLV